jgi:thiol-disulfide isomerase/thioredoxin
MGNCCSLIISSLKDVHALCETMAQISCTDLNTNALNKIYVAYLLKLLNPQYSLSINLKQNFILDEIAQKFPLEQIIDESGTSTKFTDFINSTQYLILYSGATWCKPCMAFSTFIKPYLSEIEINTVSKFIFLGGDWEEKKFEFYSEDLKMAHFSFNSEVSKFILNNLGWVTETGGSYPNLCILKISTSQILDNCIWHLASLKSSLIKVIFENQIKHVPYELFRTSLNDIYEAYELNPVTESAIYDDYDYLKIDGFLSFLNKFKLEIIQELDLDKHLVGFVYMALLPSDWTDKHIPSDENLFLNKLSQMKLEGYLKKHKANMSIEL